MIPRAKHGHAKCGPGVLRRRWDFCLAKYPRMERTEPCLRGKVYLSVCLYLSAAVAANLLVTRFGQRALIFTAFFLIPFDLFTRDILHEYWERNNLWIKMTALILSGSVISTLFSLSAWRVAVASFLSFTLSGFSDAGIYQLLHGKSVQAKMNVSNFISSILDSLAFPLIAFGSFSVSSSVKTRHGKGFLKLPSVSSKP